MNDERVTGACLCGAVAFHVELPTLFCGHCHCSMCRRNHGAAYVTWFRVPYEHFGIDEGEDVLSRYPSSEHGSRTFCSRCGSSLFCENTKHPRDIDVVLANMDGPIDKTPQFHFYYDSRADWTVVGDDLPQLAGSDGEA